ncbi:MAG: serine/threonine protein kinase [Deltaproteobacteria bacterium]|nr:serine/threonine protein kinase [Deltaproteobacteria bacterium]
MNRKISGNKATYRIIRKLGEGGFSEVFLARDTEGLVIIKVPKKDILISEELLKEEASILRDISTPSPHDHIVGFIEWIPNIPALVEEFVPGPKLDEAYSSRLATQNDAIRLALGVLSALEKLHSIGVVHGDIKPDNIILPKPLHPVLIDLGIARGIGSGRAIAGTPGWSAPEFMRGEVSPEADIYSVGVLLIYLIAGVDPRDPVNPNDIPKTIKGHLKNVIARALSLNPWERFSSAREMSLALMGASIPVNLGPRIVIQGKVVPLKDKLTIGRSRSQGGTGRADLNLQEFGGRRLIPRGPPHSWVEVVKVGTEYWISDRGSPGGVWIFENGKWRRVVDSPLKHGQLFSLGIRRRGGKVLPYIPARVYFR